MPLANVEDLILPDTPASIADAMRTLPRRAAERDFGPLCNDIVMLDTETTGLSFRDCELIEIAAALMVDGKVVDRFQTFICPSQPIPEEITKLTGISNEDVVGAPSAVDAVRDLAAFVARRPVVAHNANFDRSFVLKVPGGSAVTDRWIDSLALSRIGLPRVSSHRLASMAEAFGCDSVTHRAMDDVDALCGMWPIILQGLLDLPSGLMDLLAELHDDVEWQYREIFEHLAYSMGERADFDLVHVRDELVKQVSAPDNGDAMEMPDLRAPSREEVDEAFCPGGLLSDVYEVFESRPEQRAMAREVRDALATSTMRAIEAGTGVGKSMAYLVPAVMYARNNGVTVGVATKTNTLTDQLASKEIPALSKAMGSKIRCVNLKGYDHYPCLRRLMRACRVDLPNPDPGQYRTTKQIQDDRLTAIATVLAFACTSPDGDIDSLGIRWRSVPRFMLTTPPDECARTKCPFYRKRCMVHGARMRAASADILLTNHSLLLRNVSADGKILPPVRHWVIDEAHSFEREARRQWACEASAVEARRMFEQLGGIKSGAIHRAIGECSTGEASTLVMGLITKAASSVQRASVSSADFFDAVRGLAPIARSSQYDQIELWIDDEVRQTPEWATVAATGEAFAQRLEEAARHLGEAADTYADVKGRPSDELIEGAVSLKTFAAIVLLVCRGEDESYVYSANLRRGAAQAGSEMLKAEKLDIGSELGQRWLPEMMSVVFTSATIAVKDSFEHFNHSVGLDVLEASMHKSVALPSSFDFDHNMGVMVTRDMPAPGEQGYLRALEDALFDIHVAMGGSVLTLFTNRREMEKVYERLSTRLQAKGLKLYIQRPRGGAQTARNAFLGSESASLLALKSFWEGFDAAGDTLRCVVIPRLPFASPNDPLVRERDRREQRAWWRYSLPEAVLEVKQAAGRLIRTANDSGVLVLCDSRLVSKRYGREFVDSLPSRSVTVVSSAEFADGIADWRGTHDR